jgi:hypothetical protein
MAPTLSMRDLAVAALLVGGVWLILVINDRLG